MGENREIDIDGKTFIIDIKNIQNGTWQGTILWTQTQQKIPFRSALELIRLLDSAVGTEKSKDTEWGCREIDSLRQGQV